LYQAGVCPAENTGYSWRKHAAGNEGNEIHAFRRKPLPELTVYNVVEVIGTSKQSWEDAARNVETAAKTLGDLLLAEVVEMDMQVETGNVSEYPRVLLSFKYEG
jgi:flavin-binding protein dodecin